MARNRGEVVAKAKGHTVIGIDHHAWRALKAKHKAHSAFRRDPCWLHEYGMCLYDGAPIDYSAAPGTRMAYECDHEKPRSTHPHMVLVWSNLKASHVACNRSRQAKVVAPQQDWIKPSW